MIEEATNRLVEAARREQAQLFGRVPDSARRNGVRKDAYLRERAPGVRVEG